MTMKKELQVRVRQDSGALYEIYYVGGGQLPAQLTGIYTSVPAAEHAINVYLKEKEDATDTSKRGSEELQERAED